MPSSLPPQLQEIIIRFASSLPDLPLSIPDARTHSVQSLKVLIRKHLPSTSSSSHLNLIYAGKLLRNNDALSSALGLRISSKGKAPIYTQTSGPGPPLYIHCSLGDELSPRALAAEAAIAASLDSALRAAVLPVRTADDLDVQLPPLTPASRRGSSSSSTHLSGDASRPHGFDRLLATGWDAGDIATLRASFLAHLAHTHTPATMPAGDALRLLEDRWLDSTGPAGASAAGEGEAAGGQGGAGSEDDETGALDDTLWGSLLGFFWPWAAWWGNREGGVWTERRQMMVAAGVIMNVLFGFMRMVTSREEGF